MAQVAVIDKIEELPLTGLPARDAILNFQEKLFNSPDAKFGDLPECPLKHSFADGCYVREIFIPAGTVIVGKLHKHSHPNFLMSGEVSVFTEHRGLERLVGPLSMISEAGTKRVLYAHTDLKWITVHVTKETDLEKIEDEVIATSYLEFESEIKKLEGDVK
jgi:hypothetical protein